MARLSTYPQPLLLLSIIIFIKIYIKKTIVVIKKGCGYVDNFFQQVGALPEFI
jgi:hypothetical protein